METVCSGELASGRPTKSVPKLGGGERREIYAILAEFPL